MQQENAFVFLHQPTTVKKIVFQKEGNRQDQGSPNFFVRVPHHISYYITLGGPGILRNVVVEGYVTFYQISMFFVNSVYKLLTKCLHGPDLTRGP